MQFFFERVGVAEKGLSNCAYPFGRSRGRMFVASPKPRTLTETGPGVQTVKHMTSHLELVYFFAAHAAIISFRLGFFFRWSSARECETSSGFSRLETVLNRGFFRPANIPDFFAE